jgi:thioredoxin reductase (NADPH)
MIYDCIIIGAGPAGMIAALQMQRAGLKIVLFEKREPGGLLRNANLIENYLGIHDGISGKDIVSLFQNHMNKQGIVILREEVIAVRRRNGFLIQTEQCVYKSQYVIIATGTAPKELCIPGEELLRGKKLFYEVSDLPDTKREKTIIIIGGGDIGYDYALQLSKKNYKPFIITKDKVKCLPLLRERANAKNIRCIEHCLPERIQWSDNRVTVLCRSQSFDADYILVAIGRRPQYPHITVKNHTDIYFVGDVHNKQYRQVHIATGDALRASMNIIKSIHSHSRS